MTINYPLINLIMNIPLLICLLLFLLIESTSSLPNVIKIGMKFDWLNLSRFWLIKFDLTD